MTLLNHLLQSAQQMSQHRHLHLVDFTVGALLTQVRVSDGQHIAAGVCLTPTGEGSVNNPLRADTLEAILHAGRAYDAFARAVAVAAMNAIAQWERAATQPPPTADAPGLRDLLVEHLLAHSTPETAIVFIGHLKPVVARLREQQRQPLVFCRRHTDPAHGIYNDIFEYEALATAERVVITGAALIGSTLDAVLRASPQAQARYLIGFSAGVHPAWLHDSGITHVASLHLAQMAQDPVMHNDLEALFKYPAYLEHVEHTEKVKR